MGPSETWLKVATNSIILVVEDDQTGRYALKQLLERFDYDALLVSSGEEALAAIAVANYVCILMDIKLTGIDGFECTRRIRQLESKTGRRTPIVALTGLVGDGARRAAKEAGMDDYLSKPFEVESLRKTLLRYVYEPSKPNLKVITNIKRNQSVS